MSLMNFLRMNRTLIILFFAVLALSACDRKTTNNTTTNSVGTPNPDAFKPTGTLTGTLTDSVTLEPIVGAVIDLGVAQATTDSNGVYVFNNLPANTNLATSNTSGTYNGTIDMRNVSSPVNMTDSTITPRYMDHIPLSGITVNFSTLQDATLIKDSQANSGNDTVSSNHDTPVSGLASQKSFTTGKLDTTVSGVIHDSTNNGAAVAEAYTVELWVDSSSNTGFNTLGVPTSNTSDDYLLAKMTTTNANSASFANFSFSNVPAKMSVYIVAFNAGKTLVASSSGDFTTPGDGMTYSFDDILHKVMMAKSIDSIGPYVVGVSPENNSTTDPTTALTVTLTFNEPLKANSWALGVTPDNNGTTDRIYDLITVTGTDATGTGAAHQFTPSHTVAWETSGSSTDYSKLDITVSNLAPGAQYAVTLTNNSNLVDSAGVGMSAGSTTVNVTAASPTNAVPAAPTNLIVANSSKLTAANPIANGVNPILGWTAVTNAIKYNIYRSTLVSGVEIISQALVHTGTNAITSYTDTLATPFTDGNDDSVSYKYYITAVNLAGQESALSSAVEAKDAVAPKVTGTANCVNGNPDLTVNFSEPMDPSTASTVANYTTNETQGAVTTTFISAYQASATSVQLTASTGLNCAGASTLTVTGVKDANGVTITGNNTASH